MKQTVFSHLLRHRAACTYCGSIGKAAAALQRTANASCGELKIARREIIEDGLTLVITCRPGYHSSFLPIAHVTLRKAGTESAVSMVFAPQKHVRVFLAIFSAFAAFFFLATLAVGAGLSALSILAVALASCAMTVFGLRIGAKNLLVRLCAALHVTPVPPLMHE